MPNTRTSDENSAATLDGSELVRVVQGGGNAKATTAQFTALTTTPLASTANGSGVDMVAGSARFVSNIAALRALLDSGIGRAVALGYYLPGDGGGGTYYYDAADTTSTDNGGTIIVASDGGCWKLALSGSVSVLQFGAKGDGTTDDTARINAALAACRSVRIPAGKTCLTTNALIVPSNTTLFGDNWSSIIKTIAMASGGTGIGQRIIAIEGVSNVVIRDLQLDNSGITTFLAGNRAINAINSSLYRVENVYGKVNGSLIASANCHDYRILDNEVAIVSSDSASHSDGVIDNWGGSNNFLISGNHIAGNAIGLYGVLVTGLATDGTTATPVFKFNITNNKIFNCTQVGIWVQGRSGLAYQFTISNNNIDTITLFYGIALSDCHDFTVAANVVNNTRSNSIRAFNETPGTWTNPTYAAKQGTISGNVCIGANAGTSASNDTGSAISVTDTSQYLELAGNVVRGTTHTYAVFLGTNCSNIDVKGEQLQAGTVGALLNQATLASTNTPPGGNLYTPLLTGVLNVAASTAYATSSYERSGNVASVSMRVDVTPTAAGSAVTQLGISLPITSNITNIYDLYGSGATAFNLSCNVTGDTTNKRAQLQFPATNTSNNVFEISFKYIIR